jgi:hypothetical protein
VGTKPVVTPRCLCIVSGPHQVLLSVPAAVVLDERVGTAAGSPLAPVIRRLREEVASGPSGPGAQSNAALSCDNVDMHRPITH